MFSLLRWLYMEGSQSCKIGNGDKQDGDGNGGDGSIFFLVSDTSKFIHTEHDRWE
jgi:hypothetical protein